MRKALRKIVNGPVGALGRADYKGDTWRNVVATYLPLLLVILYYLRPGVSVADAALVWVILFAAIYVLLNWRMILRTSAGQTRNWALSQDQETPPPTSRLRRNLYYYAGAYYPGRGKDNLAVATKVASFTGVVFALILAIGRQSEEAFPVSLSVLGVAVFWAMLHTSYALYYAYLYYSRDRPGGLNFPGDEDPDHLDFAYYAFAVGTTFGVSDVTVTGKLLRRTTLIHSVISFAYGTAIVALVINALVRGF